MPERERAEELARGARAEGRVVLEVDDAPQRVAVAAPEPAEPEAGEPVGLRHRAERERTVVEIARGGQAIGPFMLELAVDLVGEEPRATLGAELDDSVEHLSRHLRARRVVRAVD